MRQIICGVYKIVCVGNRMVYIGSSNDITSRWSGHRSLLRKGRHTNGILQNCWAKYGEEAFMFDVVEMCCEEQNLEREQFWLDVYDAAWPTMNLSLEVAGLAYASKQYVVTSPSGDSEVVTNLHKFCRKHGLSPAGMSHVAHGRAAQYKSWTCRLACVDRDQWEATRRNGKRGGGWKGDYLIRHPDGKEERVTSLTAFCKKHGLSQGNMTEVAKGKRKQHKGYRCRLVGGSGNGVP